EARQRLFAGGSTEADPEAQGAGRVDASLVSPYARDGSASGGRPAARRLAAPGPRRRADHYEPLWVGERRRRAARPRRLAASDGNLGAPSCCVATPSRRTSST